MKGIDPIAPFRQLIDRRLWPLAVLLLAGLLAVPLLLAKDGAEPVPTAATGAATAPAESSTQPVVSVAEAGDAEARRKVLGSAKDPFRPAAAPRAEEVETPEATVIAEASSTGDTPAGGSTAVAPSSGSSAGAPAAPAAPVQSEAPTAASTVYELHAPVVRFGETGLEKIALRRLKALPSAKAPSVIYLGLKADRKTAAFLVDEKTTVRGDGTCQPDPGNCQVLFLKVGDAVTLDVAGAAGQIASSYRLKLARVLVMKTTDPDVERRFRTDEARGGRSALRTRLSRVGPYRYDVGTGSVKRLSVAAHRAAAARASTR